MNLRQSLRAAVLSALVIGSIVSATAVHAEPPTGQTPEEQACEASGGLWIRGVGCATLHCHDLFLGEGTPGDTEVLDGHLYFCDGFTGEWNQMDIHSRPTVPQRLRPALATPMATAKAR